MTVQDEQAVEYRCPGQDYAISRAMHLGRLARFYPACRRCPHWLDTGTLSARRVRQLGETRSRGQIRALFHEEGAGGDGPGGLSPSVARDLAAAMGVILRRQEPNGAEGNDDSSPGESGDCRRLAVIAGDGRPASGEIVAAVGEGLRWAGCGVVDAGSASAPCLADAINRLGADGGILVGNPTGRPGEVGLSFWAGGSWPLSTGGMLDQIERVYRLGVDRPTRRFGPLRRFQATAPYLAGLAEHYHALRPLRMVLDTSCRPLIGCLRRLTASVACHIVPVADELDASVVGNPRFFSPLSSGGPQFFSPLPLGDPQFFSPLPLGEGPGVRAVAPAARDTGNPKAVCPHPSPLPKGVETDRLSARILAERAHFGVVVGGNGETCRLFDERGRAVSSERLLVLIARYLLDGSAAAVVLEEGTSAAARRAIESAGGCVVVAGPRRGEMAAAMRAHGATLGGGSSGRIWYCAAGLPLPDALRTLTLLLVLLSQSDRPLSEVLDRQATAG